MIIEFDERIDNVEIEMKMMQRVKPFATSFGPQYQFDGTNLVIDVMEGTNSTKFLRKVIEILPKSINSNRAWVNFRVLSA